MPKTYRGVNITNFKDPKIRAAIANINEFLEDLSRQISVGTDPDASSTAGNVTSLSIPAGTKRTGDLTLTGGTNVTVSNSARDFSFSVGSSTATPVDVLPDNVAASGSSNGLSADDHVHAAATAAWTGAWATAADIGVADSFLRSDGNLAYPSALQTTTNDLLTLADSGVNNTLTSSITDGYLDLRLSRLKASGATAMRITWDRTEDLGGGATQQSLLNMGVTDDGGSFVSLANFYADWIPTHSGSAGPAWILVRPTTAGGHTDSFARIGVVKEDALTTFSGLDFASSGNSFSFYLNGTAVLSSISTGVQISGAGSNYVTIESANNKSMIFDIKHGVSTNPMFWVRPRSKDEEPSAGEYLFQVGSSIVDPGDTPRFNIWGQGRGTQVVTGDCTALEGGKGHVVKDQKGTPDYWRIRADSTGSIYAANIGTSAP